MTKKTTSISINVISALIILISLFIGVVGSTNSWFTANHLNGVEILLSVGELKLNLYQKIGTEEVAIYTYDENALPETTTKSYITLEDKVIPDEDVGLELILKNEDAGSSAMYLRFRFELYARGADGDRPIPTSLVNSNANFKFKEYVKNDDNSGYYYYTGSDGKNALFNQNTTGITLMKAFVVEYEDMFDETGELLNISSETLYVKLTIDASVTDWLNGAVV